MLRAKNKLRFDIKKKVERNIFKIDNGILVLFAANVLFVFIFYLFWVQKQFSGKSTKFLSFKTRYRSNWTQAHKKGHSKALPVWIGTVYEACDWSDLNGTPSLGQIWLAQL